MGMKSMEDLKYMLCDELEEIAHKGELSAGDLETIHKLTDTIKNIDKIGMLESEEGYSRYRDPYGGRYDSYDDGNSYAGRRGTHYVRGHYSRNDGYSGRGRYSYAEGKDEMAQNIRKMMQEEDMEERDKQTLRKALEVLEK